MVAAAAGLRLVLEPVLGADAPLTLFVLAVVAAAWVGGLGPGLVATAASAAAAHVVWLRHLEPAVTPGSHVVRLGVLVVVGVAVTLVNEMRHKALLRAERAAEDADRGAAALRRSEARKTTQLEVTRVLAEATTLGEAVPRVLAATARGLEWHCGELWHVDVEANVLRCAAFWHDDGPSVAEFEGASRQVTFSPGVGLPGRVWTSGEGAWITDVEKDVNFTRQAAARAAGLVSAFAFPVTFSKETLGVVCFFSRTPRAPDPELLAGLLGVGSQFGQFLRRQRVEDERTRLLESEQAARREAEHAARAKDEFLAVLSHELRTPLNAIVGWSHLLRTGQLDEEQARRAVEVIDRNAKAQAQIVADVLDVSRIVMGKVRLDVRPIELAAVVEMALDSLRPAAEAKGIRLETAIAPESPRATGDVDRLQQVVWNLLSNAVKFTPAGGRVLVQLGQADGQAEIRVEDTGMGIEPELLPHVFERFRQGDSSSTRAHGGLGLGLALVRHLVEMHGGTVTAASPGRDRGAVFVVSLPVGPGSDGARADRPRAATLPVSAPALVDAPADTPPPPPPSTTLES
jgi:signal transduction histidine kinase